MGTFDGPGLRLVVFLQGCNFRCLYCANPDTIDACGGKPTPAEEILRMATDQKPFFGRRGGVTFSGGEPTFQATALVPLVRQLHGAGIHVCLDSQRRRLEPGGRGAAGAGRPGAARRQAGRPGAPPHAHGTRQRADAAHGGMARGTRQAVLAALRTGAGLQRRRGRHPRAGRTAGRLQTGRAGRDTALPHARRSQIRSNGQRVQARRRTGEHPGTVGTCRGAFPRIFPDGRR